MGIYGSDGVVKTINAMARERQERDARRAARIEALDERLHERFAPDPRCTEPSEDLACPHCFAHYSFGDNCPICGAGLTGVSTLTAERSPVQTRRGLGDRPALGILISGAACLAFLVFVMAAFGGGLFPLLSWLMP